MLSSFHNGDCLNCGGDIFYYCLVFMTLDLNNSVVCLPLTPSVIHSKWSINTVNTLTAIIMLLFYMLLFQNV